MYKQLPQSVSYRIFISYYPCSFLYRFSLWRIPYYFLDPASFFLQIGWQFIAMQ